MDFRLPELGEGVYEAEMTRWLVQAGETVRPGQALLEVLTDKATMEVPAPFAGVITALRVQPGDKLTIGQVILSYDPVPGAVSPPTATGEPTHPSQPTVPAATAAATAATAAPPAPAAAATVAAGPAVRQLARKLGIDLSTVRGSGPRGRVLLDDLLSQVNLAAASSRPAPPPTDFGTGRRVKFVGLRRKIAQHMVLSKQTIPHYTYVDECDVTALVALRERHKAAFAARGVKLTYLPFFVKAAALALRDVPTVNSSLDDAAGELILHDHVNIGIAVATEAGLIVPVIRDADQLGILAIARAIERLSAEARAGKTKLDDVRHGTFSVTSIGNLGGLFATPVINYPEAGILGIGKIVKRPIFDDQGQVRAADMVYLSLAFDHRIVDGAVAVEFGNAVIRRLRKPEELLGPMEL
ncbi:MAG: 2-oxo acid dehydrogenase subunit E2 [Gemmataceae bacterium]|nr:2-oxo acid dehydrogenase subunit E2 [Gemmataceae bacterium]